jgi:NADH:ubiquinone oxidoreductase subunit E
MNELETKPRARHRVVLCMGEYCNLGRRADTLYKKLQPLVAELNANRYPPCIKLETARCLSMCGQGPNLVIYPEDVVLNKLDEAALEQTIRETLKPCEE